MFYLLLFSSDHWLDAFFILSSWFLCTLLRRHSLPLLHHDDILITRTYSFLFSIHLTVRKFFETSFFAIAFKPFHPSKRFIHNCCRFPMIPLCSFYSSRIMMKECDLLFCFKHYIIYSYLLIFFIKLLYYFCLS